MSNHGSSLLHTSHQVKKDLFKYLLICLRYGLLKTQTWLFWIFCLYKFKGNFGRQASNASVCRAIAPVLRKPGQNPSGCPSVVWWRYFIWLGMRIGLKLHECWGREHYRLFTPRIDWLIGYEMASIFPKICQDCNICFDGSLAGNLSKYNLALPQG